MSGMSKKPKRFRDVDGEKINELVATIHGIAVQIPTIMKEFMDCGITIKIPWFPAITIKVGPEEPKE